MSVDQTSEVQPDHDLTFTVQLHHSKRSTSPAFGVLLEIAAPKEYFKNVRKSGTPSRGDLSVKAGDQAPSGNLR